jgi:hypothetical protein
MVWTINREDEVIVDVLPEFRRCRDSGDTEDDDHQRDEK